MVLQSIHQTQYWLFYCIQLLLGDGYVNNKQITDWSLALRSIQSLCSHKWAIIQCHLEGKLALICQVILRQFVTIFADAALELGFVDIDAIVRVHKGIALGALGRDTVE
jgi:hypothetical protein